MAFSWALLKPDFVGMMWPQGAARPDPSFPAIDAVTNCWPLHVFLWEGTCLSCESSSNFCYTSVAYSSWSLQFSWTNGRDKKACKRVCSFGWSLSGFSRVDGWCHTSGDFYVFQASSGETEQSLRIYSLVDECFSSSACGDVLSFSFLGGGGR